MENSPCKRNDNHFQTMRYPGFKYPNSLEKESSLCIHAPSWNTAAIVAFQNNIYYIVLFLVDVRFLQGTGFMLGHKDIKWKKYCSMNWMQKLMIRLEKCFLWVHFFFKLLLQGGLTFILYLLCHGPIQSISALPRPTKLSLMLLGIFDLWDDDAYEVLLPGTYFGSK